MAVAFLLEVTRELVCILDKSRIGIMILKSEVLIKKIKCLKWLFWLGVISLPNYL